MGSSSYRMTHQRRVILDIVTENAGHWTADEVFLKVRRRLPNISLATVYRNLEVLSSIGLISKLDMAGNQKRFDGNQDDHYHVRCTNCGRIDDIPQDAVTSLEFRDDMFEDYGSISATVSFMGLCNDCGSALSAEEETHEDDAPGAEYLS